MDGLKSKLNFGKIKDFLFKNKKRKIIVACAFALAVVLLLCAILIPALSNKSTSLPNQGFKSEAEMLTYMTGVYTSDGGYSDYYIFNENGKCYRNFFDDVFSSYFAEYLSETKDLEALKNMTFEECMNNIMQSYLEPIDDIEIQYSSNSIVFKSKAYESTVSINNDSVTVYYPFSGDTFNMKKLADTPLECDKFKEKFENAKKAGVNALELVPSFKELKELIKSDSRTSALVNTNYSMSAINDNEDMDMFFLGKCTKANQQESAFISNVDSSAADGAGLMLKSTDPTVSLNGLLTIIDLYLQDVPTYPGESAHGEIRDKINNGKAFHDSNGTGTISEFNLYGIDFRIVYSENPNGTTLYYMILHPKTISLS
ncbi:MAG: hypothetical protein ACI4SX_01085 [Candidatus Fimenecus sp.]